MTEPADPNDPTGMELTKGSKSRLEILEETEFGESGVQLKNMAQAKLWANEVRQSGLCPKGLKTEADVMLAAQTGMELGFTAMRSLQVCVVINGTASLKGEAGLAKIRDPKVTKLCEVGCRGDKREEWVGFIKTIRTGSNVTYETTFSWDEALQAGLTEPTKWGKKQGERLPDPDAPWKKYPKRMLMWRAIGFHLRDYFSDVTNGLVITEELMDTVETERPPPRDVTPPEGLRTGRADPLFGDGTDDSTAPEESEGDMSQDGGKTAEGLDDRGGFDDGEVIDAEWEEDDVGAEVDPETGEVIPDHVGEDWDEDDDG